MIYYNEEGEARVFDSPDQAITAGFIYTKPPEKEQPATDVELVVTPTADFVRKANNQYYYFFKIPLIEEDLYTFYTSDTLFDGQNFQSESPEELLKSSVFFGGLEQVDASLADKNPMIYLYQKLKQKL